MPETAIITWEQQTAIKKISANNQSKFAQMEIETENTELRDLLGVALLQDLQNNPGTAANIALLAGTSFVNCDGQTITHKGIRYVLAFLNWCKSITDNHLNLNLKIL